MDSPPRRISPRLSSIELPDPQADPNLIRTFAGYRAALATMDTAQLMAHSADLAAKIEAGTNQTLAAALWQQLSESRSSLDQPVVRSPRTALPTSGSPDRGQARSRPSPPPMSSAVDLLAASRRLAPRIAARLVLSEARRARAERIR
jgi:hypothetical protein